MDKKYIDVNGKIKYLCIGKGAIILRDDDKEGMTSTVLKVKYICINEGQQIIAFETENSIYTIYTNL